MILVDYAETGGRFVGGLALSSRPTGAWSMTVERLLLFGLRSSIKLRHAWVACVTALLKVNNGVRVCAQPNDRLRDFLCRRNAADVDCDSLQHQSESVTLVED